MNKENHVDYTGAALKILAQYQGFSVDATDVSWVLERAAANEDSFIPLLDMQRLANWHFYNKNNQISDNPLIPGVRTSETRTRALIDLLTKKIDFFKQYLYAVNAEQVLEKAGRLLHHIQDMSTPSHVVPVYHGPGLKDAYEKFSSSYAEKLRVLYVPAGSADPSEDELTVLIRERDIQDVLGKRDLNDLFGMYDKSAMETLSYLKTSYFAVSVDGEPASLNWNAFWRELTDTDEPVWQEDNSSDEFGSFGRLGNNFGTSSFSSNGNLYEIDPKIYFDLYKTMYKKAVLESLVMMMALKERCDALTFDLQVKEQEGFGAFYTADNA